MDDRSDTALVQLARAGDQTAFVALVERHTPLLRHIARRMVGYPDLTDDLVQEAVVQAYLALPHLRDAGKARAWLCGIVMNVCRAALRLQATQPLALEAMLGGLAGKCRELVSTTPDPQQLAERHEQQALLWEVGSGTESLANPPRRNTVVLLSATVSA